MKFTAIARVLEPQIYKCSFPGCPVPVGIHISLIETLQRIVRSESGDLQGIICGHPGAVGTVVESSRPLAVFGIEEMRRAIAEAPNPAVGYYRIREGNSLELTKDELKLAVTLFAKPGSVILLIERRAGFPEANFFFLEHGAFLNLPLLEFPLDAAALTEREAQRVNVAAEEPAKPAVPLLPAPGSGSSYPPMPAEEKRASAGLLANRLWLFAIVVAVAVASFSAAVFLYQPRFRIANLGPIRSSPPDPKPSLRAERQGEDLKIVWDLSSPEVAAATSGVLEIDDAGTTRKILMTASQVRFGSLLYTPLSEQVSVRLTTLKDDQSTKQESVLVLLRRPQQPQSSGNSKQIPQVPFEVKTVRTAPARTLAPRTANREINTPVQVADPPSATQASPQHVELPASPAPVSASPQPVAVSSPPVAASLPPGSASLPVGASESRSEPAKPAIQPSPPPVEKPSQAPQQSVSPAVVSIPQSAPAKPLEEAYVAAVLISQEGVRTPPELQQIMTRPVAVSVRVNVNEAGRVTHAEAIAEKGIHALLLRAATDAALRCRFQPARRGQSPVSSAITVVFHIGPEKE